METINVYTLLQVAERDVPYDMDTCVINSSQAAVDMINQAFQLNQRPSEHFGIISLNAQMKPVGLHLAAIGAANRCYINPAPLLQAALMNNAIGMIAFHNHPGGKSEPSQEDIELTRRLRDACAIVGIELKDHLVIAEQSFTSMKGREMF